MALVEPWMGQARVRVFPELPWLADREHVASAGGGEACGRPAARVACSSDVSDFVAREEICGGFWAGEFRDPHADCAGRCGMSAPLRLTGESLREVALDQGVCIRPVMHEVYDTVTGATQLIPTPCGATRESKCPPCAQKNRRLRMQQCREGWHLDEEPERETVAADADDAEDGADVTEDLRRGGAGRRGAARTSRTCLGCRSSSGRWGRRSPARRGGPTGRACS